MLTRPGTKGPMSDHMVAPTMIIPKEWLKDAENSKRYAG